MKKIIVLLALAALVMTGCQNKDTKENVQNENDKQSETSQTQTQDKVDKVDKAEEKDQETPGQKNPAAGLRIDSMSVKTYRGATLTESVFKDHKLTVLNLWADWCGPCVEEMPEFQKLYSKLKGENIQFLGLALDSDTNMVKNIQKKLKITYPLLKNNKVFDEITSKFDYIPVTLFINSEGQVLKTYIPGGTDEAGLEAAIKKALNE